VTEWARKGWWLLLVRELVKKNHLDVDVCDSKLVDCKVEHTHGSWRTCAIVISFRSHTHFKVLNVRKDLIGSKLKMSFLKTHSCEGYFHGEVRHHKKTLTPPQQGWGTKPKVNSSVQRDINKCDTQKKKRNKIKNNSWPRKFGKQN
jgi:hypothetical protein